MRTADITIVCDLAFQKWCAEELIDPRLRDILEEAFIAGFLAREFTVPAQIAGPASETAL